MNADVPSWAGVVASVVLVAITVAVASWQRLGISRDVLVAAVRAFVQLVAIGLVLTVIFNRAGVLGALAWVGVMVVVAGVEAGRRGKGLPKPFTTAVTGIAAGTVTTLGILLALGVIDAVPRVVVPVGGMVVSASMAATALVLRGLRAVAADRRAEIEARLSLGLSASEAFAPHLRSTLRTALIPNIDTTKIVGIISLPGAMTGLILAGVPPFTAIRYQIVVMYMILAAVAVSALVTSRVAERRLFDEAQRLRSLVTH